jgi:CO/xanthine dehydrogenase Mo-binding subunit
MSVSTVTMPRLSIIAQTPAEIIGVSPSKVVVRLGESSFPVSAGSGGRWGANRSYSPRCRFQADDVTQDID